MSRSNTISEESLTEIRLYKQKIIELTSRINNLKVRLLHLWCDISGNTHTQNNQNTILNKHIICLKFLTKIQLFEQMNSELVSRLNNLMTIARYLQYMKRQFSAL